MELKINFGNGFVSPTNCNIIEHTGLESTNPDAFVQEYALNDGALYTGGRHKSRRLTFVVDFGFAVWETVLASFNALQPYKITITRDGINSYITGIIDTEVVRQSGGGVNDPVVLEISYLCPQPFFTRGEMRASFGAVGGGLELPAELPMELDFYVGGSDMIIENNSGMSIGSIITIKALSYISELKLKVGTETQALGELEAGETMVLDTINSTVEIDGVNAFNQVSWNFPKIPAGGAVLQLYDDDALIDTPYAFIVYTPKYERV